MRKTPKLAPPAVKIPKRPTPPELIPRRIVAPTLDDHLEIITRAIFQSGLSWAMIATRWDAFRDAFEQFNVKAIAMYGDFELDRLMTTDRIIHSAKKISGTFANARALLTLEAEFGGVSQYVSAHASYAVLIADIRRRFAFMGDLNCYYWLFRTANAVPQFEEWIARQDRDHPRMREMVMLARESGITGERPGF